MTLVICCAFCIFTLCVFAKPVFGDIGKTFEAILMKTYFNFKEMVLSNFKKKIIVVQHED